MDFLRSLLFFNKRNSSATAAKERLQIIVARERGHMHRQADHPDFLPELREELIQVISRYTHVNTNDIHISLERQGTLEVLDVNVVFPECLAPPSTNN